MKYLVDALDAPCPLCGQELVFEPGYPGSREEPPEPAEFYCENCADAEFDLTEEAALRLYGDDRDYEPDVDESNYNPYLGCDDPPDREDYYGYPEEA